MLVIIHSWSDTYESFAALGNRLVAEGVADAVAHVRLGDYVTMDDDVTMDDIAAALDAAWKREGLPTSPRSVDVVVHSTGGLVIRHWMTRFANPDANPIYRLLMLAPANFGSPLAHKGRSFLGRIIKGFKSDKPFETGTEILKALELGSPYSCQLAMQDRFSGHQWYGPGKVLCTVLVGTSGYGGIAAAANENGSDGTVRVSTANLNPVLIEMDYSQDPQKPSIKVFDSGHICGKTAFGRIPGENHSTIAMKDDGPRSDRTLPMMKRALMVDDAGFPAWVQELDSFSDARRTESAAEPFAQGYQNTVVLLADDSGHFVRDYFVEVFVKTPDENGVDDDLTQVIQEAVFATTHAYEDNPAYRSILINVTELYRQLADQGHALHVSVSAMPDIRKTGTVGYSTFGYDDIGSIKLLPDELKVVFAPDRTVLVDMKILRRQTENVFRFRPL